MRLAASRAGNHPSPSAAGAPLLLQLPVRAREFSFLVWPSRQWRLCRTSHESNQTACSFARCSALLNSMRSGASSTCFQLRHLTGAASSPTCSDRNERASVPTSHSASASLRECCCSSCTCPCSVCSSARLRCFPSLRSRGTTEQPQRRNLPPISTRHCSRHSVTSTQGTPRPQSNWQHWPFTPAEQRQSSNARHWNLKPGQHWHSGRQKRRSERWSG